MNRCEAVKRTREKAGRLEFITCKKQAVAFRGAVEPKTNEVTTGHHMCQKCLDRHKGKPTHAPWLDIVIIRYPVLLKTIFGS